MDIIREAINVINEITKYVPPQALVVAAVFVVLAIWYSLRRR